MFIYFQLYYIHNCDREFYANLAFLSQLDRDFSELHVMVLLIL